MLTTYTPDVLTGPWLVPPVLLAILLALSGLAKVRHTEATRSAFTQLQLPRVLTSSPAPRVLPWAEIVLAAALLLAPAPAALPVAIVATALFLTYLTVIVRALRFDHPVTCGCFGELGLGEVTVRTAVRNVLLVLVAGLTVWSATDGASPAARLLQAPGSTWGWLAMLVLTLAVVVATFGPAKPPDSAAVVAAGEDELDYTRQPLPYAALVDADGRSHTLSDLVRKGAVLLVFVSPGCSPCATAISQLATWDEWLGPVRVRAVVAQSLDTAVAMAPELEDRVLHDPDAAAARIFALGTPGAVLLGGDGMLAGGPAQGREAVSEFVEDIRAELVEAGLVTEAASV